MPRQFYIADPHFGHAAIIGLCNRPFSSIEEHDEVLIDNWNKVVGKDDTVWVVGDFSYKGQPKLIRRLFDRLNGARKHLIYGNHDHRGPDPRSVTSTMQLPWASQSHYAETVDDGQRIVMSHYSMRVWPGMHRGSVQLYGHSHGKLPGTRQCIDVGVDVFGYTPATWPQIKSMLQALPALDIMPGTDAVQGLEVEPGGYFEDGSERGWSP